MTTSLCYSVGAVDATEEACVLCGCCIQSDLREQNNEFASNFVTFKMTEQIEQQICIKFCVKLEHFPVETICIIQKASAMGNWWLVASLWQCACSWIMSRVEFFGKTPSLPGDSVFYTPDLVTCKFWLFPKVKSPLKGKSFQTVDEIQENTTGQ